MSKHGKSSSAPSPPPVVAAAAPVRPPRGPRGPGQLAQAQAAAAAAAAAAVPEKGKGKGNNNNSAPAAAAPTLECFPMSKKAVKKNGGIVKARGDIQIGSWTLKEHQRLPRQLLKEWLGLQKRPNAIFESVPANTCRSRVILPDAKGNANKVVRLQPKEEYGTRAEADEYAAILALKHLTPTLPLERKFPAPFDAAWLNFGKENTNGAISVTLANNFATQGDKNQHEKEIRRKENVKEAKIENLKRKYAVVNMSEENRSFVHDILRHLMNVQIVHSRGVDRVEMESLRGV